MYMCHFNLTEPLVCNHNYKIKYDSGKRILKFQEFGQNMSSQTMYVLHYISIHKDKFRVVGWWLTSVIPALWEARWADDEIKRSRPYWPMWWNPASTKTIKISQMWRCMPVVPATREAEEEQLLEHGRQRLQKAKMAPLHSSLSTEWNSIS